jgi:hypothetical protein
MLQALDQVYLDFLTLPKLLFLWKKVRKGSALATLARESWTSSSDTQHRTLLNASQVRTPNVPEVALTTLSLVKNIRLPALEPNSGSAYLPAEEIHVHHTSFHRVLKASFGMDRQIIHELLELSYLPFHSIEVSWFQTFLVWGLRLTIIKK